MIVAAFAPVGVYCLVIKAAGGASAVPNAASLEKIDTVSAINGHFLFLLKIYANVLISSSIFCFSL